MRFLVVDDELSFASLLGHALKRLGHQAVVKTDPAAALRLFCEEEFDAVITDIDMPDMNGVDLALALRTLRAELPIASCRGPVGEDVVLEAASSIGSLLSRVWTVADIKQFIEEMRDAQPRLAKGSQRSITPPPGVQRSTGAAGHDGRAASERSAPHSRARVWPPPEDDSLLNIIEPAPPPRGADPLDEAIDAPPASMKVASSSHVRAPAPAPRGRKRRLRITCKTWAQVEQLCDEHGAGRSHLAIRGDYELARGEKLTIALALPDELVLSVAAEVTAERRERVNGERVYEILLNGLDPETCARLLGMCAHARGTSSRRGLYVQVAE